MIKVMSYPSDLTDRQWERINHHFAPRDPRGSSHKHPKKQIVDAILYVVRTGCQWRQLPHDLPPWKTVYDHFRNWNLRGVWETALEEINQRARKKIAKAPTPRDGIIDSQSVKTQYASEERGIDGNQKVKGRKRHIVVDTLGNLLHVAVHAANHTDTKAGMGVLARAAERYPTISAFSGDAGYRGSALEYVKQALGRVLHIAEKLGEGFVVQPKRWIVERTFAWLGHFRRLAKDVEILTATAENMIRIAMLKITLAKC
jgi:putative transposase